MKYFVSDFSRLCYRLFRKTFQNIKYVIAYLFQSYDSLNNNNDYNLIYITNDAGGGTELYDRNYINDKENVLLIRHIGNSKFFWGECISNGKKRLLSTTDLIQLLQQENIDITISTFIQYSLSQINKIANALKRLKKQSGEIQITYLVHDYQCICPNNSMFFNGEYCSPCRLESTKKYLYGTSVISLKRWQEMWFMILCSCSEVRCFSNSSKEILNEAYPMLNEKLVTIVPHDMSYCHNTRIKDIDKRPFHIGIVGACHYEIKGREVVIDVLEEFGDSVPISIIGSSYRDYHIDKKMVSYFGEYKCENLQEIIEDNEVSIVVFPSLVPETFSYVISELMLMDIPIICFNLGAQAEKLSNYSKGIIAKDRINLIDILRNIKENNSFNKWRTFKLVDTI